MPYLLYGEPPVVQNPIATGTLNVSTVETLAGFFIAAGAYRVYIRNVGSAIQVGGTLGADVDITVNAQILAPGQEAYFTYVHDPATEQFLTLPAITVVNANGAGVWYRVERA